MKDLKNMSYEELIKEIDKLIKNDPTDIQLEVAIAKISLNENITNKEYTNLIHRIAEFKKFY